MRRKASSCLWLKDNKRQYFMLKMWSTGLKTRMCRGAGAQQHCRAGSRALDDPGWATCANSVTAGIPAGCELSVSNPKWITENMNEWVFGSKRFVAIQNSQDDISNAGALTARVLSPMLVNRPDTQPKLFTTSPGQILVGCVGLLSDILSLIQFIHKTSLINQKIV